MDPCLLFPVWLFLEHLTAIIDFGSHTRQAQRAPERHLVPGEYRSAEVFLQRGNHSDRAKSIPGDENTFHIGGCMLAYRFGTRKRDRSEEAGQQGSETGPILLSHRRKRDTPEEAGQEEAGQKRDRKRDRSGTGPILLSQATFLLAHIANSGPVPLSSRQ